MKSPHLRAYEGAYGGETLGLGYKEPERGIMVWWDCGWGAIPQTTSKSQHWDCQCFPGLNSTASERPVRWLSIFCDNSPSFNLAHEGFIFPEWEDWIGLGKYLSVASLDDSAGKELTWQFRRCKRCGFNPWVGKICWRTKWQPTPVLLPGKSYEQRSLVGYSSWGCKESDTAE